MQCDQCSGTGKTPGKTWQVSNGPFSTGGDRCQFCNGTGEMPVGSFDDMTHDDESDALTQLCTVPLLLSMGDVYTIAKEELNNEILAYWAQQNNRCAECGARLTDDGCPRCDEE